MAFITDGKRLLLWGPEQVKYIKGLGIKIHGIRGSHAIIREDVVQAST